MRGSPRNRREANRALLRGPTMDIRDRKKEGYF